MIKTTVITTMAARATAAKTLPSVAWMSRSPGQARIGRATLYKYFPDIESILVAWHDRQITSHLGHLASVREQADEPVEQLRAVLEAYAPASDHRRRLDLRTTRSLRQ